MVADIIENRVKALGFESVSEAYEMIAKVDLSSFEKILAFKKWQKEDATKDGLMKLMEE